MNARAQQPGEHQPISMQRPGRELVPAPKLLPIVIEFQPDAMEIEERLPPSIARLTLYAVTALVAAAILWASLSSIDEVVIARGKLITTEPTIVVQPLETSIIRSINVAVGDEVRAGQTLATLDATFSQSDVDQQKSQLSALDAQVKRLTAEVNQVNYLAISGASPDDKLQGQIFTQRQDFYKSRIRSFDQQIEGAAAVILADNNQEPILSDRRSGLVQIEHARETLYEHQTGSLLNVLSARDTRLNVDANLAQLRAKIVEDEHALAKLTADRQAFVEDYHRTAAEKLAELRSHRDAVGDQLRKMELRRHMVALKAPANAVVLDLAHLSVGSIAREAEPILTLVPLDSSLEAEVLIASRDVGRIQVDKQASIKFDAYPFQTFGTASGIVRIISRDSFSIRSQSETVVADNPPVFKARISITKSQIHDAGEPARLMPGMSLTAEIKVGRRRVISYLLYPIIRGLGNSMHEP